MRWLVVMIFGVVFAISANAQPIPGDWMTFRWGDTPASVAASGMLSEARVIDRSPQPQDGIEASDPNGIVLVTAKYAAIGSAWDAAFGFRNGRLISVKLTNQGDIRETALDTLVSIYGAPSLQTVESNNKVFRWRDAVSKKFVRCILNTDGAVSIVFRPLMAANVSDL